MKKNNLSIISYNNCFTKNGYFFYLATAVRKKPAIVAVPTCFFLIHYHKTHLNLFENIIFFTLISMFNL